MQAPVYFKSPTVMSHNPYIPDSDAPVPKERDKRLPFSKTLLAKLEKNERPKGTVVTYVIFLNFVNMDRVKQVATVKWSLILFLKISPIRWQASKCQTLILSLAILLKFDSLITFPLTEKKFLEYNVEIL